MAYVTDAQAKSPTPLTPLNGAIQKLLNCCQQAETLAVDFSNIADRLGGPAPKIGSSGPIDKEASEPPLIVRLSALIDRLEGALNDINGEAQRLQSL